MRGKRTLVVLVLAVVFGGLAGWSALRLLDQSPALAAELPDASATQVVVAARDLQVGHLLGQEDVKMVEWPSTSVPDGYARTIPDVIGRGIITSVRRNEPLLDTKMADRSGHGGLPIAIPEGMRAVSVPVDEVVSVAGFVVQGTRVDLYVTINSPSDGGEPVTKLVLQNVTVLAAGQEYRQDPQGRPTNVSVLTVLVSPEDGEKLVHAQRIGRIQLALRGMLDVRDVQTPGARVAQLLTSPRASNGGGTRRAIAATPAPNEASVVEVYKGGVKALIRF